MRSRASLTREFPARSSGVSYGFSLSRHLRPLAGVFNRFVRFFLKRWRRIHPQKRGLGTSGIPPAVRRRAFEIEAIAGLEAVVLLTIQPNLKFTAKNVQELFALVRVRLATASAGFDAKKMRLHYRLTPSQKLHANAGSGLEKFSFAGAHQTGIFGGGLKEGEDIGAIETRDTAQRGNR